MKKMAMLFLQFFKSAKGRNASLTFAVLCATVLSFGQVRFYAAAPKSVPVNSAFQLSFTVENSSAKQIKLPSLKDFKVVGGPNTSSSMQWVNGVTTQSVTYTYVLAPTKEGVFKIGKAAMEIEGVMMESNELNIEVTKAVAQQQQQAQRQPWDPFADDPFFGGGRQRQPEPQVSQEELQKQVKSDVFVKLLVSKNSVYKGEMVTATYRLYFRQNLNGFNVTKAPAFDGFWNQEVELDPKRKQEVETINGKQYYAVDILKYNLYPQRDGNLTVPTAEVSTVAQVAVKGRSRNIFDDFFGGRAVEVPLTLKTNSATVQVKDLPIAGKPDGFYGAVGKYNFETKLSNSKAKTDEPVTYTVKISGTGNLKFIELPELNWPEEFEVYDPKLKESITNGAAGLTGSKQADYLIIPRMPGDYKIEANHFSYFDPNAGKYFTINSPEFTVKVTGEPSKTVAETPADDNKKEVKALGKYIRFIKTKTPDFSTNYFAFGSWPFAALYTSPIFLFIGLIALKRRHENLELDVVGSKRRKALKLARKRLQVAEKHIAPKNKKEFYTELSQAIWGYLSHKLSIDMAELSKDNVEEKLAAKNIQLDKISRLKQLISTCELALYAPVGEGDAMKQNYELALNIIVDLEDEIK